MPVYVPVVEEEPVSLERAMCLELDASARHELLVGAVRDAVADALAALLGVPVHAVVEALDYEGEEEERIFTAGVAAYTLGDRVGKVGLRVEGVAYCRDWDSERDCAVRDLHAMYIVASPSIAERLARFAEECP